MSVNSSLRLPLDSKSQLFLQRCLQSRWDPALEASASNPLLVRSLDWRALLEFAMPAGLAPLLYDCVRDRDLAPAWVEHELANAYQQTAINNAFFSIQLHSVLDRLKRAGVAVIVLKGAALGDTLYHNSAIRPMTDIDLLIRAPDVPAAVEVLAALGYGRVGVEPRPDTTLDYENELVMRRPGPIVVTLELHWHLLDSPFYQRVVDMDWFWVTARPARVAEAQALVLGSEASLLYLSAHYALHHRAEGIRWLLDIALLVASTQESLDWSLLLHKAQSLRLVTPLKIALGQVADEWNVPIPADRLARVQVLPVSKEEQQAVGWLMAPDRPVIQRFWADLSGLPGWQERLRYALAQLFPSPDYMRERYSLAHPLLVPLAYPYRWAIGMREFLASRWIHPNREGR